MKGKGSFDMSDLLKATQDIKKVKKKIDKNKQDMKKLELKKQGLHKVFVNLLAEHSSNKLNKTTVPLRPVRVTQKRKRDNNISKMMSKFEI